MIQTSEQIDAISAALVKAQADIANVAKAGKNPHFKSNYATLADVLDEVRPKFAKHGVYIMQAAINGEGSNIGVTTRLLHSSGQWIESTLYVAPAKFDAQGAGSAVSYIRRYGLMAMAGLGAEDDDDGEAAVGRPQGQPQRAGMVRASDVPARPQVQQAWADDESPQSRAANAGTAPVNGNSTRAQTERGQASSSAGHGPTATTDASLSKAEIFRNEMKTRFARCKIPADVETLIVNNKKGLEAVKTDAPDIYAEIMTDATNCKNEMYASA